MVKSFKIDILTWLKTKIYVKDEIDTKLANKANTKHSHTSVDIEINSDEEDGMWVDEYGLHEQSSLNTVVYFHEEKLENIDDGANKTVVDSSLSSYSTNPVQNKVVNSALNGKANSSHSHSISNITNLQSALDSKSDNGHTHDDCYYTKDEINTQIGDIEATLNNILGA